MKRTPLILLLFLALLVGCTQGNTEKNLRFINNNLNAEEIKVGKSGSDVIQLWGQGEYQDGFGGYFREYENKGIKVGFSNDSDNDLYGRVSYLEIKNPEFIIFSVRIGDKKSEGIEKLKENGFVSVDYSDDVYVKGEFSIALRGENLIEYIQIYFNDKDLKDRIY